ncbi:MAG: hypothetical protein RL328_538 [Acidobacteriota bacterium]
MKRLLIASAVLLALAGAIWWSERHPEEPATTAPPKVLSLKDSDITSLEVTPRGGPATVVVKNDAGKWTLTAPSELPGDQAAIGALITAFASLTADRIIDENLTDPAGYGLEPPKISLQARTKDGKTYHLRLGEETADQTGLYASVDGDKRLYALPAFNKDAFNKTAADLRDKHLMSIEAADKVSRIELAVAGKPPIELGRENDAWRILRPRPMRADALAADALLSLVKDAQMDATMESSLAASGFASAQPLATVRVTTPAGTQTLEVRKLETDYYARSAVGTFKATPNLGPGVDKSLDDFQNKKLFDFGFDDPTKLTFKSKDDDKTFEKSGMDWLMNGRTMDSVSVQNMIDKFRDLAAASINEGSIGKAEIELTVTSKRGTEKVSLAPSGEDFAAQRDRESGVYRITAAALSELRQAVQNVQQQQATDQKSDNKK